MGFTPETQKMIDDVRKQGEALVAKAIKMTEMNRPQEPSKELWMASEYLDNGQWGILTYSNEIVVGIGFNLTRQQCYHIVHAHNLGVY